MIKIFEHYNFNKEIEEIDYSNFDVSKVADREMFDYLYSYSPETIKDYINRLKEINQRADFHPEGNVYNHTKVVVTRMAAETKDINLLLSAFLHDFGKDRTEKIENDKIMHPGHEIYSAQILDIGSPWRQWVKNLGGNPDLIKDIIFNHMIIKNMGNSKKLQNWFDNLNPKIKNCIEIFNQVDRGGW